MNSREASRSGNRPLGGVRCGVGSRCGSRTGRRRANFCIEVHRELSAHTVIDFAGKPQRIGHGSVPPSQIQLRRLEAGGGSRYCSAQVESPDVLKLHARTHGTRVEVQMPPARSVLFDLARHVEQCEWAFVIELFEINSPAVHVDSIEMRNARSGEWADKSGA